MSRFLPKGNDMYQSLKAVRSVPTKSVVSNKGHCNILLSVTAALHLVLISACATLPPLIPYPPSVTPPRTVAVLPFDNKTGSVAGARFLRKEMQRNLKNKGYVGIPLSDVDQLLTKQFGISHGGEVSESIISDIGKALKVDAVITGIVQKFGVSFGYPFSRNEVKATFNLYETGTGNRLWNYQGYAFGGFLPFSSIGEKLAETVMGRPLQAEVRELYNDLLTKMPNGAESYRP